MKSLLLTLSLACASSCGVAAEAARSTDQANLQGVWLAQTESQNGHEKRVTYQYVFKDDKLTFRDETGKETRYTFTLEPLERPKLLVIQPEDAMAGSSPVSVAYELDGDLLTIVVAPAGLRPSGISDKHDQELIVCRRKSP